MGSALPEDWRVLSVEQIAERRDRAIAIGPFGSSLTAEEYTEYGVPVVRGQDILDGNRLRGGGLVYVPPEVAERFSSCIVHDGDLIFPHRGAIGRVGLIRGREYLLSSSMMKLSCDRAVVCPEFVFYYFRERGRDELMKRASTVGTPGIGQPLSSLREIPVVVPPLDEQRAIAEVLGALDDKIAANDHTQELLARLQRAEFVTSLGRGERTVTLAEIAEFHNRRRVPLSSRQRDERRGSVPYYGAAGLLDYVDEPIFDDVLVLVGEDGSVMREDGRPVLQYIWGPSWVNNHAHVLTGNGIASELLYLALDRANVSHLVTGAVQPKLNMKNLKTLTVRIPDEDGRHALESRVIERAALGRSVTEESKALAASRDELLPLLMSGKVRVRDAERVVEEAT